MASAYRKVFCSLRRMYIYILGNCMLEEDVEFENVSGLHLADYYWVDNGGMFSFPSSYSQNYEI